jgi:hypothetical protein
VKKFELLQKTAEALRLSSDYKWTSAARCNIGHLVLVARGVRPTAAEFWQGGGGGAWCRRGQDNHVLAWLNAEYGLTRRDIESIELLNDRSIIRLLSRRGIQPAPMFNRSRLYVAAYLDAMSRREKRRERQRIRPNALLK